jgi:hypothetical protein
MRAVLLDRERPTTEWIEYIKVVQYALNTAHRQRLGTSPFEIMFGRTPRTAVSAVMEVDEGEWQPQPVELPTVQQHCKKLTGALQQLHRRVAEKHVQQRARGREKRSKGVTANFAVGDYVLRARVGSRGSHPNSRRRGADPIASRQHRRITCSRYNIC